MKVEAGDNFKKVYKKRFSSKPKIKKRFDERVRKFAENPNDPVLKDHALSGKLKGFRAFSVTGDIRVIYYIHKGVAYTSITAICSYTPYTHSLARVANSSKMSIFDRYWYPQPGLRKVKETKNAW